MQPSPELRRFIANGQRETNWGVFGMNLKKSLYLAFVFAILFASSGDSYSGLPPANIKGDSEATARTSFFTRVPNNQATAVAGVTNRIETGNSNILANPSFEHTTATTSWTTGGSGFSAAADTSNYFEGVKSVAITASSSTDGTFSQSVTPTQQFGGTNFEFSCKLKTTLSTVELCALNGGSAVECVDVPSSSNWVPVIINGVAPGSGSVGVQIRSDGSSTTGTINVDDCYVGPARNIGTVAQATFYGSATQPGATNCVFSTTGSSSENTYNNMGSAGSCASNWTNVGAVSVSGPTTTVLTLNNLPPGSYQVTLVSAALNNSGGQVCNFRFTDGTTPFGYAVASSDSSDTVGPIIGNISYATAGNRTFTIQASATSTNQCNIQNEAVGRKIEWIVYRYPTQSQQIVSAEQQDYGWTAYTPTFQGLGSVTNIECFQSRVSQNLKVQCKFTSGTATAVEARLGLPSGLTSADTSVIPSIRMAGGKVSADAAATYDFWPTIQPSVSYVTFGQQNSGGVLTKLNGDTLFGAGVVYLVWFEIPISGWASNQRAPSLVGSVTSTGSGSYRLESAHFSGATYTSNCTSTPCTLFGSSTGWLSSVSRSGTGLYTLNFKPGVFSAGPVCTFSCVSAGAATTNGFLDTGAPTSSSYTLATSNTSSFASADSHCEVQCMGPK